MGSKINISPTLGWSLVAASFLIGVVLFIRGCNNSSHKEYHHATIVREFQRRSKDDKARDADVQLYPFFYMLIDGDNEYYYKSSSRISGPDFKTVSFSRAAPNIPATSPIRSINLTKEEVEEETQEDEETVEVFLTPDEEPVAVQASDEATHEMMEGLISNEVPASEPVPVESSSSAPVESSPSSDAAAGADGGGSSSD